MRRLLRFRIIRFTLLGLILVCVMLVSAVTAMRFAIHGREVSVPKFVATKEAEAQRIAVDNGLVVTEDDRFYSSTVPAGAVISQSPSAGVRVRRGARVRITVSLGPPKAEVPNLVGQSTRAAQINLQRRGLDAGQVSEIKLPDSPEPQVIAQSPPANVVASSPKVNLLVSNSGEQMFLMPDLIGKDVAEISKQIQDAGFELKIAGAIVPANKLPKSGVIVKQSPLPGSHITARSAINVEIATR
jgi:beta-lactam-binding protein with PASTA domain